MSWVQTFTGKRFDPLDPNPDLIDILDIAHSLAMTCRFNGHVREFYSVAQHSVLVSRLVATEYGLDPELELAALLHDAAEAYLGDITAPLKPRMWVAMDEHNEVLARARWVESAILEEVAAVFGLSWPFDPRISVIDKRLCLDEANALLGDLVQPGAWQAHAGGNGPLGVAIEPWPWRQAEQEFLMRFEALQAKRDLDQQARAA